MGVSNCKLSCQSLNSHWQWSVIWSTFQKLSPRAASALLWLLWLLVHHFKYSHILFFSIWNYRQFVTSWKHLSPLSKEISIHPPHPSCSTTASITGKLSWNFLTLESSSSQTLFSWSLYRACLDPFVSTLSFGINNMFPYLVPHLQIHIF